MKRIIIFLISILGLLNIMHAQNNSPGSSELFQMSDIQYWTGKGAKKAAMVIQWKTKNGTHCYVWGYRFDDDVTFMEMMTEIIENDINLAVLKMPAFGTMMGTGGIGYNPNNDGKPFSLKYQDDILPLYKGVYSSSTSYNIEKFKAADPTHFWDGGWYVGKYCSYWVGDAIDNMGYSGMMPEFMDVEDGSWHGWTFSPLYEIDPETGDFGNIEVDPSAAQAAPKPLVSRDNTIAKPTEKITIGQKEYVILLGDSVSVQAEILPTDATFNAAYWESSDNYVAYVINGKVYGAGDGTATITASAIDNPSIKATCKVTVGSTHVTKVILDKHGYDLVAPQTLQLNASVEPGNATVKTVNWRSSDLSIASVVDGLVIPKNSGTVKIYAESKSDPDIKDVCEVRITKIGVESIKLNKNNLKLFIGGTEELSVAFTPENASFKTVVWQESSAQEVIKVSKGVVTAVAKGTATIRVTSEENPEAFDECTVQVLSIDEEDPFTISVNSDEDWDIKNIYPLDCSSGNTANVIIEPRSGFELVIDGQVVSDGTFSVTANKPSIVKKDFTIKSTVNDEERDYTFTLEKYFNFDDIVAVMWNNTLMAKSNSTVNGGYTFTSYRWFKNNEVVSNKHFYSAGGSKSDLLDTNADYSLEVTTDNGDVLHTCKSKITLRNNSMTIYPNPISAGSKAVVEIDADEEILTNGEIRLYNMQGNHIKTIKANGQKTTIDVPSGAGNYILRFNSGNFHREGKIVVK